jgi:dolichol-phosphate mannosyltransferase
MTKRYDLSLIVPTYNESANLERLVSSVVSVLADHRIAGELIVVDDHSPDGTGTLADRLAERFPMQVVHREGKLGLGSAVLAGFERASSEVLGVMDADLSHPPSAVPGMFAALRTFDADIVVGSRYVPGGGSNNWPWQRLVMSRLAGLLARPITPVRDATSGLFLVRRHAVEGVRISATGFKICLELLSRARIGSVVEFPFVFADRSAGESKMSVREAIGYLRQLRDLYALRLMARRASGLRYRRVAESEMRAWVRPEERPAPEPVGSSLTREL